MCGSSPACRSPTRRAATNASAGGRSRPSTSQEINSNGYSFQIEMTHRLWRQGMRIVEVPIVFTERVQGHSKMSGHIIQEALIMVWRLWFQNKMRRRPAVPTCQTG